MWATSHICKQTKQNMSAYLCSSKVCIKTRFCARFIVFQSPTTSCTRWLEPEIEGWWFWVGPLLGLAKWVPRGEAQGDDLQQPPRVSLAHHRDGARCHCRQHLPSLSLLWSKSSQLRIAIAFSFACVASDLLGPAAEAHAHTYTYTYSTHNGWHSGLDYAHRTLVCSLDFVETAPAASQTKFLQSMSGSVFIWIWDWSVVHLCSNFMDHMHTHTIHCVNCHVMASRRVEPA